MCALLAGPGAVRTAVAAESCVACHGERSAGFAAGHAFARAACTSCHAGDPAATGRDDAHRDLVAHPGHMSNARRACGNCHAEQVTGVASSRMHTGHGVVATTRAVFGEHRAAGAAHGWSSLGHTPADSLLRKLCASCHLGHEPDAGALGPRGRGGGCLACHLGGRPGEGHVRLDRAVPDDRCFGCHARSGRISLSYAGLAEAGEGGTAARARLSDGRIVERRPADVHHFAGMACIDCHTRSTLMGLGGESGVDIACTDCHRRADNVAPGAATTARRGTPLEHIESRGGRRYLRRKLDGATLAIPAYDSRQHPREDEHVRLECDACHAAWAPQCHGCHVEYDPDGEQWDHQAGALTAGRWRERRWAVRNDEPPLGVDERSRIRPFVPGMVLTISHPDFEAPRFARLFAPLSPHTTGRGRSCESCHRSPVAVGLGRGTLLLDSAPPSFVPAAPLREDGLAEDAWTGFGRARPGESARLGARSFTEAEIRRILGASISTDER